MTKENYDKAGILLEQIEKTELLQKKIQSKYNQYKETDAELCQVLNSCNEALDVLKDIDTKKFENL